MQIESPAANSDERRSSSLRRENRDTVKEISQNGNNGNVSSSKSITNIAPSTPQKTGRMSNGNMSGNTNSVIFPLLSDVSDSHSFFSNKTNFHCHSSIKTLRLFNFCKLDSEEVSLFWEKCIGGRPHRSARRIRIGRTQLSRH